MATEAGRRVLLAGGNAFDAAVAIAAALAVVEPYSSGIGGGGFFLLHRAKDGLQVMLDARERAPYAAHRDMFLNDKGDIIPQASVTGALSTAIPGIPAALEHICKHYGSLPLAQSLLPAIRLAERGFPVTRRYRRFARFRLDALRSFAGTSEIFLANGEVPPLGHNIVQSELARTLRAIAGGGASAFYQGDIARKLVAGVQKHGGIWSLQDLADYRVVERPPAVGRYREIRIVSAAPPSSGGIVLLEALNILERFNLSSSHPERAHLIVEALRRAYRDRARFLGDPDFVLIPQKHLLSKAYARTLSATIDKNRATPSDALNATPHSEGTNTTHFSVVDDQGNRIAATLSINYPFGSALVAPGTGVLLNDEMDDFSSHPMSPNVYGLVGERANAIEPGKRPLSSMAPTFLEHRNRIGILGTPGGSRIISMVLLATLDFAASHGPYSWVGLPRFHHQYLPDELQHELGTFTPYEQRALSALGHRLKVLDQPYGNMQAIMWDGRWQQFQAAADPRGEGNALALQVQQKR